MFNFFKRVFKRPKVVDFQYRGTFLDSIAIVEFGDKTQRSYFGSCTVWNQMSNGKRAGTGLEVLLSEAAALDRYKRNK